MKLILVLMIVILKGNPIDGIEPDSEGIEEMFKSMMNEIKDLILSLVYKKKPKDNQGQAKKTF